MKKSLKKSRRPRLAGREKMSADQALVTLVEHLLKAGTDLGALGVIAGARSLAGSPQTTSDRAMVQSHNAGFLTPEQAASILGLRPKTLANWRSRGDPELQFTKVGRGVRYSVDDIGKFLAARHRRNTSDNGGHDDV